MLIISITFYFGYFSTVSVSLYYKYLHQMCMD